ncbi:putative nucleic acid-binding protein [Helianthus annuus]|uniref:cingulin-like n=1 Tax=Helianthus annuus TaxID=4232 RepID=UPI000B8FA92F|nr:cingulin-like [Helianthus annuus]KAJ0477875.1 putative nucleic acid-binding protein [Helianthus annuus]KAJ0498703.1 putative nucleic acid-binding protein [Helianthus annuus]KAJ0664717.1 putative nucleic acid-binding protein [Helianthus annuus]
MANCQGLSRTALEDALLVSEKNVSQLSEEKRELEVSKIQAEQEMEILKDESGRLNIKLMETLKTLKLLEDKVADSEKTISLLTEEKSEIEVAKCRVEEELHKAMEEVTSQTSKFQEALALAENNMFMIMSEKEEAQMEVKKVKEEVSSHASNLDEAKKTIKSLEDAILQLNTNVSRFSQENEKAEDSRTVLVSEIKKLKEEAEQEISTLKTELDTCRQELAAKNGKMAPQLEGFFGNLQVFLKDQSLLFLFKQSFERKIESLREIDHLLKDMKDNIDSEHLQDHRDIELHIQPCYSTNMSSSLNMNTSGSGAGCQMALVDLREGSTGPITVMVCRKWDVTSVNGRYMSTDYVVSDKKGGVMHCTARNNIAHYFFDKLKEGGIYLLKGFTIQNTDQYRILKDSPFVIGLNGSTIVKKVDDASGSFTRYPFLLTAFEDLQPTEGKFFVDVVGYVTQVGPQSVKASGARTVEFNLTNERKRGVRVTLWG